MTTYQKDRKLNKITFWQNGVQVYPTHITGNIHTFANGDIILL